ncbi:MAG: hypothetical protein NVS3B5_03820 [Sphingomicrobium sp.]
MQEQSERLANGYFSGFTAELITLAELYPISGLIGGLAMAEMALRKTQGSAQYHQSDCNDGNSKY